MTEGRAGDDQLESNGPVPTKTCLAPAYHPSSQGHCAPHTSPRTSDISPIPGVTIIFVAAGASRLLVRAMSSLLTNHPGIPIEVIIVANLESAARPNPRIRIPQSSGVQLRLITVNANLGYGRAANCALRLARSELVAIANPDIEFLPGTLSNLVNWLSTHPETGIVAPQFLWPDLSAQPSARRYPRLRYLLAGRRLAHLRLGLDLGLAQEFQYAGIEDQPDAVSVETAIGAFLLTRRELLTRLGGFDERFILFVEDVDLCQRCRQAGLDVAVLPWARMIHLGGGTRATAPASTEFLRLRSFLHYFRDVYSHRFLLTRLLTILFGLYLTLLLVGRALGIREREHRGLRRASNEQ
ncbi:MAG: glycosyltransferase [candidate division WOR-3 bacterium]